MFGSLFWITRKVVFGATSLFSIIVITLGSLTMSRGDEYESALLWIITGVVTVLTLPAMLFFTIFRNGALTPKFSFEVCWTFFLCILWVAVAGSSLSISGLQASCSRYDSPLLNSNGDVQGCKNSSAISILGFLSWIFLMLYDLLAFFMCCCGKISASDTNTNFTDLEIDDTKIDIDYDIKIPPTDPEKCPPPGPYEIPTDPQQTADSLTDAKTLYTATPPYSQPQSATGSLSTGEERLYPNHRPPPYEPKTPIVPQRQTADYSFTQAGIPYTAATSYYRQPRAVTRPYYRHGRTTHASLDRVDRMAPPVYLMPITSDGTVVVMQPPI